MPPRLRPAAAAPPRVARRRRPAAADAQVDAPAVGAEAVKEKYQRGEEVRAIEVPLGTYQSGDWLVITSGIYYQKATEAAGKVIKEEIESGERELRLELTGTQSEELLRFGTSLRPPHLRLHLCGDQCGQLRENPDLLHALKVRKISPEGVKTWETNLIAEVETQGLQEEQAAWKKREEEKAKKRKKSSSSSGSKKRKKKKKSKKKEKKEEAEPEGGRQRQKIGGKGVAKKELKALYAGTGLDPSPKVRRRLVRKTKKALKKEKSTSSTSSSSSSTTSTMEGGDSSSILQDRSRVHRIARLAPGLLTATAIEGMKVYLSQGLGTGWEAESESLPPLLSMYHRTFLLQKLSGGVGREFATLCHSGDLLLQGRPSEALDNIIQRLKSLEMTASGSPWSTSQKLELTPVTDASLGSRVEYTSWHRRRPSWTRQ